MNFRKLAKTGEYHVRRARVRVMSLPRSVRWLRHSFHIPPNRTVDPLEAVPSDGVITRRLDPGETFIRPLPHTEKDSPESKFFALHRREDCGQSYVSEIPGGGFWGSSAGAVFAPDGRFMPAFTRDPWGPELHAVWTRAKLPPRRHFAGSTLYLVTPEATDNYHHWIIDLLPRIGLVLKAGFAPGSFDRIVVNHSGRAYQLETLARLGFDPDRIVAADERLHGRAELLVVPSLKAGNQCFPAEDARFLRAQFAGSPSAGGTGRRLYLSRRGAAFRRLLNEGEILGLLAEHGFEAISPGDFGVAEQAKLFGDAELIAGVSGAGFANLVFASPRARAIEIAPPQWLSVYHWMISARLSLDHSVVVGDGPSMGCQPEISGRTCDVLLPPARLARALSREPEHAPA